MEGVGSQDNFIDLRLFFLRHDAQHGVLIQLPGLTEFFHPLGLGQRWSSLFTVDRLHQKRLFIWFKSRDLIGGGHGDFPIVHHLLKFRDQLCECDVIADSIAAYTHLRTNLIIATEIRRNFRRIFSMLYCGPSGPPLDSIQFHLIGFSPLAGKNIFPLEVTVHHENNSGVPVQIPDNYRHGVQSCQFAGVFAPVSGHQLIAAALAGAGDGGHENAVFLDALHGFLHRIIIPYGKRMVGERIQFGQRDVLHLFQFRVLTLLLRGEQISGRCQLYFSRAAFQAVTPPASDFHRLQPPSRRGHGQKCSYPRRWSPWPGQNGVSQNRIP